MWTNDMGTSTSVSKNILTYQQINLNEKYKYILPAIEELCNHIKELKKKYNKEILSIVFYHMNNAKFQYVLIQHSQWSRLNHLFLRCRCRQGVDVKKNEKYTCMIITKEEEQAFYNKSKKPWNREMKKIM